MKELPIFFAAELFKSEQMSLSSKSRLLVEWENLGNAESSIWTGHLH